MNNAYGRHRGMTVARRALIVQHVLVDGWTSAEAAAAFGVSERQVSVWVADFRRSGMTSLRREPCRTLTTQIFYFAIARPVRAVAFGISGALRRLLNRKRLSQPSPLRRLSEDRSRD
jgi:transposase-like protein